MEANFEHRKLGCLVIWCPALVHVKWTVSGIKHGNILNKSGHCRTSWKLHQHNSEGNLSKFAIFRHSHYTKFSINIKNQYFRIVRNKITPCGQWKLDQNFSTSAKIGTVFVVGSILSQGKYTCHNNNCMYIYMI